jgi:hypothetical protein
MSGIFFNFREEERLKIINYFQGRERKEKKEKRDCCRYARVDTVPTMTGHPF